MVGLGTLRRVARELRHDVAAAHARDPAARGVSSLEILAAWPGVQALLAHRVAHVLAEAGVPFAPRMLALASRSFTNIEIHPRAQVGEALFIDHGTGVVIGETAEVGDGCTIYQGVTLGGTSLAPGTKRHPTLGAGVIVGAGAKVLGGFTVGEGARIGSNAIVVKAVPPGATVVGPVGKVLEQTRELGLLRVVGTTQAQVRRLVLFQAWIMALVGVIPGTLAAIGVAYIINLCTLPLIGHEVEFTLHPGPLCAGPIFAVLMVLLSAVLPAQRAARIQISSALLYE